MNLTEINIRYDLLSLLKYRTRRSIYGFTIIFGLLLLRTVASTQGNFSSVYCLQQLISDHDTIAFDQRDLNVYAAEQGIQRSSLHAPFEIGLNIYNHGSADLESQIDYQLSALNEAYQVDSTLYRQLLTTDLPDKSNSYSLIEFSLAAIQIDDSSWQSIYPSIQSRDGQINVHIYDELPPELRFGYAHFPWIYSNREAVILSDYFGRGSEEFAGGHSLTHIIGNYLGLFPLTGEYPCGDDYVQDTPIHNVAAFTCDRGLNVTSTCDNQFMNSTNYMSQAPDACKDHFTLGQWRRMLHLLTRDIEQSQNQSE